MIIELKIKDIQKTDFDRIVAKIHPKIMKDLNLLSGDIIEIFNPKNNKFTSVNAFQANSEDKNILFLSLLTKKNLEAKNGDVVQVKRAQIKLAESVTFAEIGKSQNLKIPKT